MKEHRERPYATHVEALRLRIEEQARLPLLDDNHAVCGRTQRPEVRIASTAL
jgi:hypothetical protein